MKRNLWQPGARTRAFTNGRRPSSMPSLWVDGYEIQIVSGSDGRRTDLERDLDAAGVALPLQGRLAWRAVDAESGMIFGLVRNGTGRPLCGFGGRVGRSRAYPGFSIVRVERFAEECEAGAARAAVAALGEWVRSRRVLRLHLEVHTTSQAMRTAVTEACVAFGWRRHVMRSYAKTVKLDLTPAPEVIFDNLHATARRHIRAVEKRPVEIGVIDDPSFAGRMNELLRESLERTGGRFQRQPFAQLIRFANEHPRLARVVGLFRKDASGPEALIAFAVGYHHGSHTEYGHAGCTRQTDVRMPLMYGLAWDLILWSRDNGAQWFDFGGIKGDTSSVESTDGIADFKRYFVRTAVDVGEEWVLEPHPIRAAVARGIVSVANGIASVAGLMSALPNGSGWLRLAPKQSDRIELAS